MRKQDYILWAICISIITGLTIGFWDNFVMARSFADGFTGGFIGMLFGTSVTGFLMWDQFK